MGSEGKEMHAEVMMVTPEMAQKWLSNNPNVRRLRQHRVALLANAIRSGHFRTTHQGIAIRVDGALVDGQHRLAAIVMAGRPVRMMVTTQLPFDATAVVDSGLPRQVFERLGADRLDASICSMLLRCAAGKHRPQEYEVELCLEIFTPYLRECETDIEGWRAKKKVGTAAGLAAMLLLVSSSRHDPAGLAEMKRMMGQALNAELFGAPRSVINFYRQCTEGVQVVGVDSGGAAAQIRFCRAWIAMQPKNKDHKVLFVRDHKKTLSEAVVAFDFVTKGVFADGTATE